LDLFDPDIQFHRRRGCGSRGIPGTSRFFKLPGGFQQGKLFSQVCALFGLFLRQILFRLQEEMLCAFQQRLALFLVGPTLSTF
jgi:hypothetical protein